MAAKKTAKKPGRTMMTAAAAPRRRRRRSALARVAGGAIAAARSPVRRRRAAHYMTEKTSDILMSEATSLSAHFLGNELDMRLPKVMGVRPTWIASAVSFLGAVFIPRHWWKGKAKHLSRKVLDGFLHSILGDQLHERKIEASTSGSPEV